MKRSFEKIHSRAYYDTFYYNPDAGLYMSFSKRQLSSQISEQKLGILYEVPELNDFPTVFHAHKRETLPVRIVSPLMMGPAYLGQMMMERLHASQTVCHRGLSFTDMNARTAPDIILTEADLELKQSLGQMFDTDRRIMTRPELASRFQTLQNALWATGVNTPPRGEFVLKGRSLTGQVRL